MSCRPRLPVLAGALLLACAAPAERPAAAPPPTLGVHVDSGHVTAPDSIAAGWHALRVTEAGGSHILVAFRLGRAVADGQLPAVLAALDGTGADPSVALAIGGPEVGDTGEAILDFTPGRYLLACVSRGEDGHRHLAAGEARLLVATAAPPAPAPSGTVRLELRDFAYGGPDRWPAGPARLEIVNLGRQDHQVRIAHLKEGVSIRDWLHADDPGDVALTEVGMARMGPGTTAFLDVQLARGAYVLYCLVADPASGRQHVDLGMVRPMQVD